MIILMGFIYQINLIANEMSYFYEYYQNLPTFYEISSYLENFQKVFYLEGINFIKIRVIYYCNSSNISISNPFNSSNVAVFDEDFNYIPSSSNSNYINFTVLSKLPLNNNNICVFDGYIGNSSEFVINLNISGNPPIETYYLYNFTIDDLNPFYFLFKKYNIYITFDGNCTEIKSKQPEIETFLPSYSLNILNVSVINITGSNITLSITNIGNCPVNLNKFLYFTNSSLYEINIDNPILYPNETQNITFYNYENYFYLVSLGFSKRII